MLKKAQILISLFALLVMANGCGEPFRSNDFTVSESTEQELFDDSGNRHSLNTPDNDMFILQRYANELRGEEDATRDLASRIRAFDMIFSADGQGQLSMQARLMISCNETYSFESNIVLNQLRAMQVQRLGRDGDYEVEIRCSQRNCQEMIAAIRKFQGPDRGTVLVGLGLAGQGGTQVLFVSRRVEYDPYFARFPNVIDYGRVNRCEFENPSTPNDPPDTIVEMLTDQAVEEAEDFFAEVVEEVTTNITEGIRDELEELF